MKKILILLAIVTLAAGCNKMFDANYANDLKNAPVTVTAGANIDQAKTYTTPGQPKVENGETVKEGDLDVFTRSVFSTNADGDCTTWDEDYVQEEGSKASNLNVRVIKRYNFRTGKYTVTTTVSNGNTTTAIKLTLTDNENVEINIFKEGDTEKVEITVNSENGVTQIELNMDDMDITSPDPANPNTSIINGTWYVKKTYATTKGAVFNKEGLDIHGIAEWAKGLGLIQEKDVEETVGYTVKNVMIMDSSIAINFENGKSFASTLNTASLSNFTVEDFAGNDSDSVKKYFNGTGSFNFSGDLCLLTIDGSIKGENESNATPITITLTLTK